MAHLNINQIRVKRGNTLTISSYTGPSGELVLNTQTNQLVSQDGITAGGHLVTGDFSGIEANLTILQTEVANIAGITGNVAQLESYFANVNLEEITASISTIQTELSANGSATIGNLTTNLITFPYGNIASDVVGPGLTLLANVDAGQEFLGMFIGNTSNQEQGYIYVEQNNVGVAVTNLTTNQSYDWSFNQDGSMSLAGNLLFGDNSLQTTAYQGPAGQTSFATTGYVDTANSYVQSYTTNAISTAVNNLINSAPGTLDTLGQIAANLANEGSAIGAITNSITNINANITSTNLAIVTANSAVVSYVNAQDSVISTAWMSNAATQQNLINTLQTQVYTNANTGAYLSTYLPTYTGNLTAGNLTVTGNINYVGNVNTINIQTGTFQGNAAGFGALYAGILSGYTYQPQTVLQNSTNFNGYAQVNHQNINPGSVASTDYVATADIGTANAGYIDMGINGSGFVGGVGNELNNALDGYLYVQGTAGINGNLILGTGNSADIVFTTGGFSTTNNYQGRFKNNVGLILAQTTPSTSTSTGALQVAGGAGIAGNVFAGNVSATGFFYANGTPFVSSNYGNTQVSAYLAAYSGTLINSSSIQTINTEITGIYANNAGLYNSILGANSAIQTLSANIGAFETYANLHFGTSNYGNSNVASYLTNYSGNITAVNYNFANSVNILSTVPSINTVNTINTTVNALVANVTTGYINTQGNVQGGNVIASGFYYANGIPLLGGGGGSASTGNITFSAYTISTTANVAGPAIILNPANGGKIVLDSYTGINNQNPGLWLGVGDGSGSAVNNTGNIDIGFSNGNVAALYRGDVAFDWDWGDSYGAGTNPGTPHANFGLYKQGGSNYSNPFMTFAYASGNVTFGNLSATGVATNNHLFANGVNILSTVNMYSNTNVAAYLTTTTITTTGNITAGNLTTSGTYTVAAITTTGSYGNITGANVISANTLQVSNGIFWANGTAWSSTSGGTTYSNTNVAAYLTSATITTTGNVTANYFVGNGSSLTGLTYNQAGNIYGSSSNVTLQAGSYNWTFDNTGNLTIPTNSNIVYANGTVFSSGTGSIGGTNYTNANVIAMLSANTAVFVGNIGNLNIGNLQANTTSLFLGANTVISNYGSPTFGYASHIGNNIYFDANSVQRYRNTQTGASDLIVGPGTLYWYASSSAVTANAATGWTGATGAYMAISTSGMSLYNGAGITSSGAITIQNATGLVTNQATTGLFQNASTINAATPSGILSVGQSAYSSGYIGNVTIGAGTVQTGALPLTVRASGTYNIIILSSIAGGYNSPPYNNQAVTGGSGTGMTASYSSVGGYVNQSSIVVTNPGTGYKNGDIVTLPGGGGSTAQIYNYNPNISNGTTVGTANYVFGIDGNLTLPGNVLHAANSAIYGDFTNSTVNYRTIFRPLAGNSSPGIYAAPSGNATAASWQAVNTSNLTNASKILIATNGTTDVQLVSGINGTGTYLPLSFLTNGTTQMQLDVGGNLNMIAGGNIATTGNITAGNVIANHYGNSIGTTATYSGNITASSVIASGSSGPQTRFLWDTWQANSTSALSSFTPSGTIGGNATWDSTQAYGLKLTTNTTSQSGYINWNSSTINYNYDMVITASIAASGGTGADGQWIYFGSNAAITGNPGNTNTYGGIAVMNHYYSSASQFEVYVGGTQTNIPFIGNGNYVTSGVTLWNASYTSFYNLTLKIRKIQNGNRMLEVYLNEIYQGSVNIGSWTPVGNYFGVAAYTGGSTAQNWVRQLRIDW